MPDPDHPAAQAAGAPVSSRRIFLRRVLGLAGAGVVGTGVLATLTGCDIFGAEKNPVSPPVALAGFLSDTAALADSYDATIAAIATLATLLTPVRDAHRAHVRALAEAIGAPTPAPPPGRSAAPTDREPALAALVAAEQAARDDAVKKCLDSPPRTAALLGSIAAARASHLEVLR